MSDSERIMHGAPFQLQVSKKGGGVERKRTQREDPARWLSKRIKQLYSGTYALHQDAIGSDT